MTKFHTLYTNVQVGHFSLVTNRPVIAYSESHDHLLEITFEIQISPFKELK